MVEASLTMELKERLSQFGDSVSPLSYRLDTDLRESLTNLTERLRETQKLIAESEGQLETGVKLNQDADKKTNSAGSGGHL